MGWQVTSRVGCSNTTDSSMRIDQALVHRGLCDSRSEAQECISQGVVLLNGVPTTKQTKKVTDTDTLEVTNRRKFVSRGGEKLEGALQYVYRSLEQVSRAMKGKSALDIGSSTGGFTDCLLLYGAKSVTAVDVGTSQLHNKLKMDNRVTSYENTDIRDFNVDKAYDFIVADVSFIALEKIMDVILNFVTDTTELFLLIKPQFEVGKGNTKKGIVKDELLLKSILKKYETQLENNFSQVLIFPCTIKGGDGNQEYFLYATRGERRK